MKKILALTLTLLTCACASTYKSNLEFNPTEPLRVVVLPFAQVDQKGAIIDVNSDLAIDKVNLVSSKLGEAPAEFVRKLVQSELGKSALDIFSPALIDSELSHHGFADPKLKLNLAKIFSADPKQLCTHLVNCDAVLYGKVTKWDRSYYGIQSVNSVGIDLKLVSVRDGKELFSSNAQDSDGRGLSKGPTGFSDLVIEPLRGLDNAIITDLARKMVPKMLADLKVESRPDYLQSQPPAIYAAAHDAHSGKLSKNGVLTVLAFGSSYDSAAFSIGNVIQNVPMVEQDESHYIGEYYPLPTDSFETQPVYVTLTDEYGRVTKEELGSGPVSLLR